MTHPAAGLPRFCGRERELRALLELHKQRRDVLIVGSPGLGKSALLQQARAQAAFLLVDRPLEMDAIFDSIRNQLIEVQSQEDRRVSHEALLRKIELMAEPVVFDSVAGISKELEEFILSLRRKVPIWIASRSGMPHEIGCNAEMLNDFVRLTLSPLKLMSVRSLLSQQVARGELRKAAVAHAKNIYCLCRGNPRILLALLNELSKPEVRDELDFLRCLEELRQRMADDPCAPGRG